MACTVNVAGVRLDGSMSSRVVSRVSETICWPPSRTFASGRNGTGSVSWCGWSDEDAGRAVTSPRGLGIGLLRGWGEAVMPPAPLSGASRVASR